MDKATIILLGSQTHTRGGQKYTKGIPVQSSDPEEIAYCQARSVFKVIGLPPEPVAAPPKQESVLTDPDSAEPEEPKAYEVSRTRGRPKKVRT